MASDRSGLHGQVLHQDVVAGFLGPRESPLNQSRKESEYWLAVKELK